MNTATKYVLGILTVAILITATYVTFSKQLKIRVDDDKSTFYVLEDSRWRVSGREYNSLFDGTSKMNRRLAGISVETFVDEVNNVTSIIRTTPYIRGPVIKEKYLFDGKITDREMFPVFHTVEIFNASGFFYRYEVRDLIYDGKSKRLTGTYHSFGRSMKVNWQEGYRWARAYKSGILKVQYDIPSDYESFEVKLFDPVSRFSLTKECTNKTIRRSKYIPTFRDKETLANGTIVKEIVRIDRVFFDDTVCESVDYIHNGNKKIRYGNFNCKKKGNRIICDSKLDGNGDGLCQNGESCVIIEKDVKGIGYLGESIKKAIA